jgi:hypothetical protein
MRLSNICPGSGRFVLLILRTRRIAQSNRHTVSYISQNAFPCRIPFISQTPEAIKQLPEKLFTISPNSQDRHRIGTDATLCLH